MGKVLPPVYFLLALATMVGLHFLWPVAVRVGPQVTPGRVRSAPVRVLTYD